MASITFTIPAGEATRVLDAFAAYHNYQDNVSNPAYDPDVDPPELQTIANPQTKAQFTKSKIIDFVKESVKAEEARAAKAAIVTAADPNLT